jgi:tetratricopeptide (TPR) repeat protein
VSAAFIPRWLAERAAREQSDREKEAELREQRETAKAREAALQELGTLWAQVVLEKKELHIAANDPRKVFARIRAAVERVSEYIRRHPRQPQGYYVRARGRLYLNALKEAEQDLRESIRIEPGFAPGHALLGRVKFEEYTRRLYGYSGTAEERMRRARPLLEQAEESLRRGWSQGEEEASIARWGLPMTREDQVAETLVKAMVIQYIREQRGEAFRIVREAHEKDGSEEFANFLGNNSADDGENLDWQTRALERMPHFAKALFDRANARQARAEHDEAIADYSRAIELDPSMAMAYINRGSSRQVRGDLEGAITDYTRAIELEPLLGAAYNNRANAFKAKGLFREAIDDCTKAIEVDPKFALAYANRGDGRRATGDIDGAIADLSRAVELDPMLALAYNNRGVARMAKGMSDEAIEDYGRAIELDPRNSSMYVNRGKARSARRDLEGAIEDYSRAVEHDPKNFEAYNCRGNARKARGDWKGAIEDYGRAIEANPRYAGAYNNRGNARQQSGDLEGAIEDYTRAIEIDPKLGMAYFNRGNALKALGDPDAAMENYTRAIALNPRHAAAYANRGMARLDRSADVEELKLAERDLVRAMEVADPAWSDRSKVASILRRIRERLGRSDY